MLWMLWKKVVNNLMLNMRNIQSLMSQNMKHNLDDNLKNMKLEGLKDQNSNDHILMRIFYM